jgi:hypothetical protein
MERKIARRWLKKNMWKIVDHPSPSTLRYRDKCLSVLKNKQSDLSLNKDMELWIKIKSIKPIIGRIYGM